MPKIAFILVLFVFSTSLVVVGQKLVFVGVCSGMSYNNIRTNTSNLQTTKLRPVLGLYFDINSQLLLTKNFSIQSGITFLQKNYRLDRLDELQGIYIQENNSYLQIPICAQMRASSKNWIFFIGGGIYGAYWIAGKVQGKIPNLLNLSTQSNGVDIYNFFKVTSFNQNYNFEKKRDNRFEFGGYTALEIGYQITDYFFFLEVQYFHSLSDQQRKYSIHQIPRFNQTFCFALGCKIKIRL